MNLIEEISELFQKAVCTSEDASNSGIHAPICMVEDFLNSQPGVEVLRDEFDTNGWQYDWWLPFTLNGKRYSAFGSGYNGGLAFFCCE